MAHFLSASDFAIAAIEDELEDERRKYLLVAYLVLQLQKEEQKKKEWKKERQYRGPSLKPRLQALQRAQSIRYAHTPLNFPSF